MQTPPPKPLSEQALGQDGTRLSFHGTGVVLDGVGVLILGPSGSGKSSLALALLAHGAHLIADDGIWLDGITLTRPDTAAPLIEAYGIGLLNAGHIVHTAPLRLVVDLSQPEPQRLPPRRVASVNGQNVPLILGAGQQTLAYAILHLLRHGKIDPDP